MIFISIGLATKNTRPLIGYNGGGGCRFFSFSVSHGFYFKFGAIWQKKNPMSIKIKSLRDFIF